MRPASMGDSQPNGCFFCFWGADQGVQQNVVGPVGVADPVDAPPLEAHDPAAEIELADAALFGWPLTETHARGAAKGCAPLPQLVPLYSVTVLVHAAPATPPQP